jgi:hypothetical protein
VPPSLARSPSKKKKIPSKLPEKNGPKKMAPKIAETAAVEIFLGSEATLS